MPIPSVKKSETQNDYVGRCMHEIASEYDTNEQAVAICISTYQKENMSKDFTSKVAMKIEGTNMIRLAADADEIISELAEKPYEPYPFDQCVQDQLDKGYDDQSAHAICGFIKREYGH